MRTIKTALAIGMTLFFLNTPSIHANPIHGDDWLHTDGNQIVDKEGNPVWLTGANWFGFNTTERTFHGLWSVNLESTLQVLADRGINILRVPISTELLWEWRNGEFTTPNVNGSSNPELAGKTSLAIFDQFLESAQNVGMKVLLDVHSAEADNSGHIARLWYKGNITPEIFYQSWEWVTERYKNNDTIIAMDIENEPHGKPWTDPDYAKWDSSTDKNNFKHACETASKRILAINPELLVLCEGIESYPRDSVTWQGNAGTEYFNTWWGGNLRGVRDHPIDLGVHQDQLVYSPHDYGPLVYKQKWFNKNFNRNTLQADAWNDNWLFIHDENIAPLLIGEWGGFLDGGDNQKWMEALRDQIIEDRLHHTFWVVNPNSGDTGGLLKNDWLSFDEEKYAILKPALWKNKKGKFIGLDHEVPLGSTATGISLSEHYSEKRKKRNNRNKNRKIINESSSKAQLNHTIAGTIQSPQIFIQSPQNNTDIFTNERFMIEVDYENAAGFNIHFNGNTQSILEDNIATMTAPVIPGNYPITITAIDKNRTPLEAKGSVNIIVKQVITNNINDKSNNVNCIIGTPNVWPSGFTIEKIVVKNDSLNAISNWTATLDFPNNMSLSNGWNAKYSGKSGVITASNETYNGNIQAGESTTFGLQGNYTGEFIIPNCKITVN